MIQMRKHEVRSYIALAILFAAYSVIAFAAPFHRNGVFWLAYACGAAAVAYQAFSLKAAFFRECDVKSRIYGIPIVKLGVVYLTVQMTASFLEMAFSKAAPFWMALIVNAVLLALAGIGGIAADGAREEIERQDAHLKRDCLKMRELQSFSVSLYGQCSDEALRKALKSVTEELNYSDPVSSERTRAMEDKIMGQLQEIQGALAKRDEADIVTLCAGAVAAIKERNRLCALGK